MIQSLLRWYEVQRQHYCPRPRRPYEYPINRFYAHKVDLVLTWAADRLGLSPNFITLISMACGVGAGFAIYLGHFVLGAVLIQAHHLLDGVDGNLARANNKCSEFGRWLDMVSDQLTRLSILLGLAFASNLDVVIVYFTFTTFYFDLFLVHFYILPFAKHQNLYRAKWKQWFMRRGLIVGFDIFTLYFLISICLLLESPDSAILFIGVLKSLDWLYRLYEVEVSKYRCRASHQ